MLTTYVDVQAGSVKSQMLSFSQHQYAILHYYVPESRGEAGKAPCIEGEQESDKLLSLIFSAEKGIAKVSPCTELLVGEKHFQMVSERFLL